MPTTAHGPRPHQGARTLACQDSSRRGFRQIAGWCGDAHSCPQPPTTAGDHMPPSRQRAEHRSWGQRSARAGTCLTGGWALCRCSAGRKRRGGGRRGTRARWTRTANVCAPPRAARQRWASRRGGPPGWVRTSAGQHAGGSAKAHMVGFVQPRYSAGPDLLPGQVRDLARELSCAVGQRRPIPAPSRILPAGTRPLRRAYTRPAGWPRPRPGATTSACLPPPDTGRGSPRSRCRSATAR